MVVVNRPIMGKTMVTHSENTGNQSTNCTKLGILPTSTPFAIGAVYVTLLVVSVYHLWSFQKIGRHKNIFHLQAGLGTLRNKHL